MAGINTAILVSSSFTLHWAQASIKRGNRFGLKAGMLLTFLLGCTFLFIQINEYANIGFAPQDHAQQTIFYSLTGLHGAHVFIGLLLLLSVTIRSFRGHYSPESYRGVEVPGIYWHFVDIMWLVVYTTVYVLLGPCRPPASGVPRRATRAVGALTVLNPMRSDGGEAFRLLLYADRARDGALIARPPDRRSCARVAVSAAGAI